MTLDQLRGFFIVVIIIDHLSRFPSLFGLLSGKALLWVTAAEGFVGISGLLVGYVRGYKNRSQPFQDVSKKLIRRGGMLYLWSLIASVVYTAIIWYVPLIGGSPSTPMAVGDWQTLLFQLVTLQYTFVWVHFLTLYAIFLVVSPGAVWLFRHGKSWAVALISFGLLILGWITHLEALQWQFLFFLPSIAGFHLTSIQAWWRRQTSTRRAAVQAIVISGTIVTIVMSVIFTYYAGTFQNFADQVNALFPKDSISLLRAGMAFLWFTGYLFVFAHFRNGISRMFNWLLIPIGTRSLTAYILHGLSLCIISFFTVGGGDLGTNTLLGALAVMIVWTLLRVPIVRKVIPS